MRRFQARKGALPRRSRTEPGKRRDFLAEACAGDYDLGREVESLLAGGGSPSTPPGIHSGGVSGFEIKYWEQFQSFSLKVNNPTMGPDARFVGPSLMEFPSNSDNCYQWPIRKIW